ncbi:translation initiation factor IF-2 [Rhodopseudomonas julia]|uniref:Translation initiation factor IF-2 n=2 Tax=Nitrobacteraceae TaxID=41294 RepID=A0ABU0C5C6_9BRAD|nr:translation initiation factor IF-2 [Rhodopseudomonas julia]MDQ0325373.1 translation initiation factor IF-2 [Rhodopseudomonas julia]
MSETTSKGDKTLRVGGRKTLSLRRDTDTVRQSFSGGRSKAVVVEKKRRRHGGGDRPDAPETPIQTTTRPTQAAKAPPPPPTPPVREQQQRGRTGLVLKSLTEDERDARAQALADARVREAEERRQAEIEAARRAEEEKRLAQEREEAARRQAEEDKRRAAETEARSRSEDAAGKREPTPGAGEQAAAPAAASSAPVATAKAAKAAPAAAGGAAGSADEAPKEIRAVQRPKRPEVAKPAKKTAGGGDRRRGRLTVTNALEDGDRERSLASIRRKREKEKRQQSGFSPSNEKIMRDVVIPEAISVQDLANRMAERAVDVIRLLMKSGTMVKITDILDADTAQIVAEEMGHNVRRVAASDVEEGLFDEPDAPEDRLPRPPVVTIMGHVDHGKTSLLDAIRETKVVAGEAGGITQHIGAYQVEKNGQKITFIDTPGHAAFTAMRARGAQATDIVVLVVAADDGVMPQTVEAINHARAAGVPMIVAINKIDKPDSDPMRVKTDLLQHSVVTESMSGDTLEVEVSATKRINLDGLLEAILLQSELLDLKANPNRSAEGIVVEAQLDRGRGPVATVLVQRGTLHSGDIIVAGSEWGRVRALIDDTGAQVKEAGPSRAVEVLGFQGTPEAGDRVAVVESEGRAREISEYRQRVRREKAVARQTGQRGSLEQMMNQLQVEGTKTFPLVIKGDVQGSVEAIIGALDKISTDEVAADIVHSGVGGITESDITLAAASNAAVLGFNVRANKQAREAAARDGVEIRYYNIIYDLTDDVKAAMSGMLSPERRETFIGNAEILEVFNITKVGKVAGCRVTEGKVERGAGVRLIRDNVVVHEGRLSTLKRFKDEVREVPGGQECGMAFEKYEDMRVGDIIECYRVEEVARTL